MNLTPGYYTTRDDHRAYVAAVGAPFEVGKCAQAIGWIEGMVGSCSWSLDGHVWAGEDSEIDLISPWTDPWDYVPQPGEFAWTTHAAMPTPNVRAWCNPESMKRDGYRFAKADVSPCPPVRKESK